jgi:integrase
VSASKTTGIETRHGLKCPAKADRSKRCNGKGCSHRGYVWDSGKRSNGPRFASVDEARSWRTNRLNEIAKGASRKTTTVTLNEAWATWLSKAKAGTIRTRSGGVYKPAALRGYAEGMARVLPDHGGLTLSRIDNAGLQRLISAQITEGRSPSTIRNTITPLRALFRDSGEIIPGGVSPDPTVGLRLPSVVKVAKERVAVADVHALVAALKERDRPLWALLLFAGLRIGEARALRWRDVDYADGLILVRRNWDRVEGAGDPKSAAGRRDVPMPAALREQLETLTTGKPDDLVFGRRDGRPFNERTVTDRANKAWKTAGLERVNPHGARHLYAALMIAAGTDLKALSTYMGHASVNITADLYGSLMKGTEAKDAARLDALLAA